MKLKIEAVRQEFTHIRTTANILEANLRKPSWDATELVGVGTLISNLYMGIERVFRFFLEDAEIKIAKNETWHIDMLRAAKAEGLVPEGLDETLRGMLNYRHLQVHGYGYMLDEERIRNNAPDALRAADMFEKHIKERLKSRGVWENI